MKKLTILSSILFLVLTSTLSASTEDIWNDATLLGIEFLEIEESLESDLDLVKHLPDGFDPYMGMRIDPAMVHFEEEETLISLGFDTTPYLPKDFNPYLGL